MAWNADTEHGRVEDYLIPFLSSYQRLNSSHWICNPANVPSLYLRFVKEITFLLLHDTIPAYLGSREY